MLWLQKRLGDRLAVEPSASVPFGTLKELLGHHHENASINAIITHRLKAVAELDPDAQRLEWASELKTCRCGSKPSPFVLVTLLKCNVLHM